MKTIANSFNAVLAQAATASTRPICEIAAEIQRDWNSIGKGVGYAAKPYLEALLTLATPEDVYYCDTGKSCALYFLSNATSYRGENAKRLKAELKEAYGIR